MWRYLCNGCGRKCRTLFPKCTKNKGSWLHFQSILLRFARGKGGKAVAVPHKVCSAKLFCTNMHCVVVFTGLTKRCAFVVESTYFGKSRSATAQLLKRVGVSHGAEKGASFWHQSIFENIESLCRNSSNFWLLLFLAVLSMI